jgi:hypothetical protein
MLYCRQDIIVFQGGDGRGYRNMYKIPQWRMIKLLRQITTMTFNKNIAPNKPRHDGAPAVAALPQTGSGPLLILH